MSDIFIINGQVREKECGVGLEGLIVRAYDKDLLYDDLLGEAETDSDGGFRIVSDGKDFRDFFEQRPDIYLRILLPGNTADDSPREIFNTLHAIQWNARHLSYIVVNIPATIVHSLPSATADAEHTAAAPTLRISRCRNVYLRIEKVPAYSPVAPDDAEHDRYRHDCLRGKGHENSAIPQGEIDRRRLDGLVYREYLDSCYTVLKNTPLIAADINEPRVERRIPGTVIYAEPGERLYIHVCNADDEPHSLHVHGLIYGIDSDGSWPFGVHDSAGRRSDAICPGQTWCYMFDVTEDTIGAWPFHDHHMHITEVVNRGLFGGIVVRDPRAPKADYEAPVFFHRLVPKQGEPGFDSGTLNTGGSFSHTYTAEGTFAYQCRFHPMYGTVRVTAGGPATAAVSIIDGPGRFAPDDVTVGVGGTVTWTHAAAEPHTVTDAGGAALESYAINGRTFVGNTPTIVARSGKRIRWYVFNLDFQSGWHNFHLHSQRWQVGNERMDTRSLGPAESFVADTIVPPVVLFPLKSDCQPPKRQRGDDDCGCGKQLGLKRAQLPLMANRATMTVPHGAGGGHHAAAVNTEIPNAMPVDNEHQDEPRDETTIGRLPRRVRLQGDFLLHCHVEMHMMEGMVAVVRAIHDVTLTAELKKALGFEPPLASDVPCPDVPMHPCAQGGKGSWERLPDLPIFVVHAALLHTGKVLLWSGTAEVGDPLESRLWDPGTGTLTTQTYGQDLFCSGHAFLPDGRLCIVGGAPAGTLRSTHLFDPLTEVWTPVANMSEARWYPTVLTLPDGHILAASGSGATQLEIYDANTDTWQFLAGAGRAFSELYPSLHLLPSGQVFYSRAGWAQADMVQTHTAYLTFTGALSGIWNDLGQQQFYDRQEGTTFLQIDATVSPPATRLGIIGGGVSGPPVTRNPQSVELIDLTVPGAAAWTRGADMLFPRTNVNAVLLPDGTVLVIGGQRNGKWNPSPGAVLEAEIYDPIGNTWTQVASMSFPRQYHSVAVLLPDGRVLCAGGVDPTPGVPNRDQRNMEIFSPPYLSLGPRPSITATPASIAYGAGFNIDTPHAAQIDSVALLRPASVTHHTDGGARYIKLPILARTAGNLGTQAPANGNIAPPGYYLLFVIMDGVPSIGQFVRIG